MSGANIHTGCQYECESTWRYEHGHSNPGGPFPGTNAEPDDVRRCEHGNIWLFRRVIESRFYTKHDLWHRLHPFWDWRARRRAIRALTVDTETRLALIDLNK